MKNKYFAHMAILGANIIYGINYTVAKEIIPEWMHPSALVLCRVVGATILYWLFAMLYPKEKIEKKDFFTLILAGIFGVATNQLLFLKGLSLTTPINASIIMTANPILVLLIASIILHEKITLKKIFGIILGAGGALLLILNSGKISFSSDEFVGNLLVFLNALSYGIYLVIIKPLMNKYSPVTIIKWVFIFGMLAVFPFGTNDFINVNWSSIPVEIIYAIAFVVFATTFLAYLLNIYGLKRLSPTTVSIYIYSQPILASIVSILANKDNLTFIKILSTVLVFAGIFFVSQKKSKG